MASITEDELQQVQNLKASLDQIVVALGELHLNKILINSELKKLEQEQLFQESKFEEFREKERVLYTTLQEKYGTGSINLETGEITE